MHWVNRGPEPNGLKAIRTQYTPSWVQYYQKGLGAKPSDIFWRRFLDDLGNAFRGLCAYCEERSKGEVDHFRPKSRYPEFVYCWSNWVFSCHDCNQSKGSEWPAGGYVDPCARSKAAHPETYFTFDTQTGEILAKKQLSPRRRAKAQRTIDDLNLNDFHHLKKRLEWLHLVSAIFPGFPTRLTTDAEAEITRLTSRSAPFSSITRALLSAKGYSIVTK